MARTSLKQPEQIRLLLDQGFPKPPGFEPSDVDRNLDWIHLWDWKRELSERSTPDWVVYCEAAFGGFNAIVTRDFTQAEQAEEIGRGSGSSPARSPSRPAQEAKERMDGWRAQARRSQHVIAVAHDSVGVGDAALEHLDVGHAGKATER